MKRADDRGTILIRKLAAKYTIPLNPSVIFFFGPWLGVSILIFWKLFVDRRIFPAVCCGTIRTKLLFLHWRPCGFGTGSTFSATRTRKSVSNCYCSSTERRRSEEEMLAAFEQWVINPLDSLRDSFSNELDYLIHFPSEFKRRSLSYRSLVDPPSYQPSPTCWNHQHI